MKSIKEKAEEFAKENINSLGYIAQEHVDGYVAGANYVLDKIESIMKNVSKEYPLFQQGAIVHVRLIKLLEQLKK